MKLVIATPLYPPEPGGPATYAKVLEEELPKRAAGAWEVEVVKFGEVRALPKAARHIAYMRRVYRAAKQADAVLALDPVSVGFPAMLAARFARRPFFVKIVGDYAWEQGVQRFGVTQSLDEFVAARMQRSGRVRALQAIEHLVALAAKRVIVPSEYLKRIVGAWGVPAAKITVVYNAGPQTESSGSGAEGFSPGESPAMPFEKPSAPPRGEVVRQMPAVPQPYLITVARLVPWKGIPDALRALSLLRARAAFKNLRYLVLGDGPERDNLEALARDLGLGDAVIFAGAAPHGAALRYMRNAAAFILPTRYEGLSHTILEAFVEGAPVVTTPVGGNPELIEDGVTGLMAPAGSPEALADAVARLLGDQALRGMLITSARAKVEAFTRERMIEGTIAALSAR